MPEQPRVVVSNEPAAIPFYSSPVFTGSLAGLGASVYAIIQVYKPGVSVLQQLETLWPPIVAAIGTALAAWKRYASTAQPITGTQAAADKIKATVNTNPPQGEEKEVPSAPRAPSEKMSLEQLALTVEFVKRFHPQFATLAKIGETLQSATTPPTRET